ncbi:MAG: hypothetical protein HFE52_08795 [Clostridia bacterium]|jgi:hypothetical protein|nr:hypothetical protein [Clostridia bacterium]
MIILIIYMILGYWAVGRTIYANKVVIYTGTTFMAKKIGLGLFFGWILIPIAILKLFFGRK